MAKHRAAASGPLRPSPGHGRVGAGVIDPGWARLAWEFLRRNPRYRADYEKVQAGLLGAFPEHWGLWTPIDPNGPDIDITAIWRVAPPALGEAEEDEARFG